MSAERETENAVRESSVMCHLISMFFIDVQSILIFTSNWRRLFKSMQLVKREHFIQIGWSNQSVFTIFHLRKKHKSIEPMFECTVRER